MPSDNELFDGGRYADEPDVPFEAPAPEPDQEQPRPAPPAAKFREYGMRVRPVVEASLYERRDAVGRKQPKPLGSGGILAVAMRCGLPAPTDVPSEFWSQDVTGDRFSCAVVACPCGEEPSVEVGCLAPCKCQRYFYFLGDRVVVWRVPADVPSDTQG